MTNEEAIESLKFQMFLAKKYIEYCPNERGIEALDMAIKALEQQPITWIVGKDNCQVAVRNMSIDKMQKICAIIGEEKQQPSREWKEIYAESEGSNSWIEFKCPHCGYSFGMESGEYDWHYGDEIPWKYCPICGGSAEHKPYKAGSEDKE